MQNFKRIALLASVCLCASAQAQITQIQGSDPISASRATINNNFTYLQGKQSSGTGAPSAGSCASGTVGTVYTDTNASGLFYVCQHTGTGYSWVPPSTPNAVLTTGSYPNPTWLPSLDWSKLINIPASPNSQIQLNGSNLPQRGNTNLVPATGVTITTADNPGTNTTTLTFSASGGGGGGSGTVGPGTSGQLPAYLVSGNAVTGVTVGGDVAFNATTGNVTVNRTQNVPFSPSATTDTTNPANIPYTSAANGASASNLKNAANTFLTPDNFGCHMVADSTTDNSCLGNAINSALAAGNNIRIPAPNNTTSGTYHYYAVRSPLTINLRGHFSTDVNQGLTIECDGAGTTIAYTGADTTQGLLKFVGSLGAALDNVTIKGCTLASTVPSQYVVQFYGVSGPRLNDVNIRVANGATVQYGVQYLGSQQGAVIGGGNTNAQTGIYLGSLFSSSRGTQTTSTTSTVAPTDSTIQIGICNTLNGNAGSNVFVLDAEHIRASGCSAGTVTVARTCGQLGSSLCRGMEGTQPASHASGATVTTGFTVLSDQIDITGGVQMVCQQNCVYADGIDDGLLEGNSLGNFTGNSIVLINGSGAGAYKVWGNNITASAGTAFYVLGGRADISGNTGTSSAILNCVAGSCYLHDNHNLSGSITYSLSSGGSYHDNTITNTIQSQVVLSSPSLISYNNSLPTDVNFSNSGHIFRLDSPIALTSNYTPPNGDIASFGVNANAPPTAYGLNISGSSANGQAAYLRFNSGVAMGVAAGSQTLQIAPDDTFQGTIASFGSGSIAFNRSVTGVQFNGIGSNPYQANGVNGAIGQANIGACSFVFNGILTSGVGSSPVTCGYYQTILNGASAMPQRAKLAFTGSGVSMSDSGDTTTVTISGGGGSSSGGASTSYSQTVSAQTSLAITAAQHKQGAHPMISCSDNSTPANYVDCKATVDSSGNVAFSWPTAFTGSVTVAGGSSVSIPGASSVIAQYALDFSGQNLFLSSNNLGDTTNWPFFRATGSSQSLAGPLGPSITAWSIADDSTNNSHSLEQDTTPAAPGSTYTISWYVKPQGANHWAFIFTGDDSFADNVFFDISACTVGTASPKMFGATATAALNGWCRISVSHTDTGSRIFGIGIAPADSTVFYTGTGAGQFYIYGGQFVIGTSTVSYSSDTSTTLTVADSSGLGHNGASGTAPNVPAFASSGLYWTSGSPAQSNLTGQYVYLPNALNNWKTAAFSLCTYPGQTTSGTEAGGQWATFPALLGANSGDGTWIVNGGSLSAHGEGGWIPTFYSASGGAFTTTAAEGNNVGGCHVIVYECGTPNRMFVDGTETGYASQSSSACPVTTSQYVIGGSPAGGTDNIFNGAVQYAAFFNSPLPADIVKSLSSYISTAVSSRAGYPAYPINPNPSQADQLVGVGDSITAGYAAGGSTWTGAIGSLLNNTYNVTNMGVGATDARTYNAIGNQTYLGPLGIAPAASKNTVVVWLGTNDLEGIGQTAAQAWANLVGIGKKVHAAGGRAIVVSMISRTGWDSSKNSLNALIREFWKRSGAFDGLADIGGTTTLGCDGCSTNATYFPDGTHLNGTTETTVVAPLIANIVNQIDGYNESYPHTYSASATLTPADTFVVASPSLGTGQTLTAFDCSGMTGSVYTIANLSANSATFAPQSGQGSSATISAGSTARFLVTLVSPSAGGCTWIRTQ